MLVFATLVVDQVMMVAVAAEESYYFRLSTDGQLPEKLVIQIQAKWHSRRLGKAEKEKLFSIAS